MPAGASRSSAPLIPIAALGTAAAAGARATGTRTMRRRRRSSIRSPRTRFPVGAFSAAAAASAVTGVVGGIFGGGWRPLRRRKLSGIWRLRWGLWARQHRRRIQKPLAASLHNIFGRSSTLWARMLTILLPGNNLSIGGISIAEGWARASVNNAYRAGLYRHCQSTARLRRRGGDIWRRGIVLH